MIMGNTISRTGSSAGRVFTQTKRYAWIFVLLVALGGLWEPRLGLLLIPLMLTLMVMGFLKGKYWCGNLCPHGSLFDGIFLPWSRNLNIPVFLRSKILAGLLLTLFIVMLGTRLANVLPTLGQSGFLDKLGFVFVLNYFVVTVAGTVLALLVNPRAWCVVCPMGTFQLLLYRLGSRLRLNRKWDLRLEASNSKECRSCKRCYKACPLELEPYPENLINKSFDHGACLRCSTCVQHCPSRVLKLGYPPVGAEHTFKYQ